MLVRVTITKIETVLVDDKHLVRLSDKGNREDGGPVYGYAPTKMEERKQTTQIFEQEVELDNIVGIVKAVNNL